MRVTENRHIVEKREKVWRSLDIILLCTAVSGVVLTLYFVFTKLRFYYGVDYHMAHAWMAGYMQTGLFYPKDTVFYNFPLTVIAFGPWLLLPVGAAVKLKFAQTALLSVVCVWLLMKLKPGILKMENSTPFAFFILLATFFLAQLCYLNIYVEVAACLMACLYFQQQGKEAWAGFFLSLAVVFKVFLAPLFLVPLLTRKYKLFAWAVIFILGSGCLSIAIFGLTTHMDMLRAMGETYARMRLHGISYPYVADGFAGWQDMFNKLVVTGLMDKGMVFPLTLTMAGLYGCLFLYTCYLIHRCYENTANDSGYYARVFASMVIFCIGFNFRFDHGTLLFSALPFFGDLRKNERGLLVLSLTMMTLSRLLVEQVFSIMGWIGAGSIVSKLFYVLSFQFIGINLMVLLVVNHWVGEERNVRGCSVGEKNE